jgi:hypothetical protein
VGFEGCWLRAVQSIVPERVVSDAKRRSEVSVDRDEGVVVGAHPRSKTFSAELHGSGSGGVSGAGGGAGVSSSRFGRSAALAAARIAAPAEAERNNISTALPIEEQLAPGPPRTAIMCFFRSSSFTG